MPKLADTLRNGPLISWMKRLPRDRNAAESASGGPSMKGGGAVTIVHERSWRESPVSPGQALHHRMGGLPSDHRPGSKQPQVVFNNPDGQDPDDEVA